MKIRPNSYYLTDESWMNILWKSKSLSHARSSGERAFYENIPIENNPYKEGLYKREFEIGYELAQSGLPF